MRPTAGATFPPLIAFKVTDRQFPKPLLVAGFHRHKGFGEAGLTECQVDLREGTFNDAWLAGWQSNVAHGLRYTNADKRKAAEMALKLWREDSARVIAERISVSHDLVCKIRKEFVAIGELEPEQKVRGKDGKNYRDTQEPPQVSSDDTCDQERTRAVDEGRLSISLAAKVAKLTPEQQQAILDDPDPKAAARLATQNVPPANVVSVTHVATETLDEVLSRSDHPAAEPLAPTNNEKAIASEPAYRRYVPAEEVTTKVTKRELVDEDLSGPARARLIQGLDAAKLVVATITEAIEGLRSERLNPLELPVRFAAIAEQLRQSGETFAALSAMPIEDMSRAVLHKYANAVDKKMKGELDEEGASRLAMVANREILKKLIAR